MKHERPLEARAVGGAVRRLFRRVTPPTPPPAQSRQSEFLGARRGSM
jgi:hypothetical protein